jgi:DNA-binding MarR family transcriptional regulator
MDELYELALCLKAGNRGIERAMNEALAPLGVTGPQSDAIVVIGQAGPISLKDLGELLIAEAGHPSRLVDRLVEAGYVERVPAAEDRRRVELSLTAAGGQLARKIEKKRREVLALAGGLLGDRDLGPTLELLRSMLEHTPFGELIERRRELFEAAERS